jgi:urea carboxylase
MAAANMIGFPVMLKATAGGGGIGMRLCRAHAELADAFAAVQRLGKANFKHAGLYLDKYIERARHIEVQIFGDGKGTVLALGERDCSAQRRNQKVIEETPAPGIDDGLRKQLFDAAVKLGQAVGYESAGTVEFIFDDDTKNFYFLEVNTRLQVEHTVTEEVLGEDLVEWMLKQAAGELSLAGYAPKPRGAAIQVRLYAEDPSKNFQPSSGVLTEVSFPPKSRVDTWVATGTEITSFYDPLVAKMIVHGSTRADAVDRLRDALHHTRLSGIETNLAYLSSIIDQPTFADGKVTTGFLNTFKFTPATIDVLKAGMQTTVQDGPGRLGYWNIGVPPSGPMDGKSFALAAALVGNPANAAGLECTLLGPTLRFNTPATIAIVGADMQASIDGSPAAMNRAIEVKAGSVLEMKAVRGPGARTYVAFRGGLDVTSYLGSKSTFTLGKFGGHAGRALRVGDVLRVSEISTATKPQATTTPPVLTNKWEIAVLYGPHGAPDFFLPEDIEMFFATAWNVHHHSDRTGIRLIGPHPKWARTDGGEAGLHPSNIHDNAYAVGTIDFTGNLPIILGPDGPSLGGFVCPATIIAADLWKIGQLKAGDAIKFVPVSQPAARAMETNPSPPQFELGSPIIHKLSATKQRPAVVYRQDGDKYLLVEYGPLQLDLNLRFRVHVLMQRLEADRLRGIIDLTPGIRSLHIHFDSRVLPQEALMEHLAAIEDQLPDVDHIEVPARIVHLPLSWDDPACQLAIQKYMQMVRADAPWCPSNIEFIRRINGLDSIEDVKKIVFDASYLVLGLGDVYLGAPVATPLDPRHRLVTTKYNPARTWTAENSVGIGGAYLCVYGMEGPGGYQFVGRTCQMWNTYRQTSDFVESKPWLLRFFDQIRFYPVSASELLKFRTAFSLGQVKLDITHETFSLHQYNQFLADNREPIAAFKSKQQAAFDAERRRWDEAGVATFTSGTLPDSADTDVAAVAEGLEGVFADVSGNMWKVYVKTGDAVKAGQVLAIVESMKTEIPVTSPTPGQIADVFAVEGKLVAAGQLLFSVKP